MRYNRCGRSGLKLPAISLGLWHNFGGVDVFENGRKMVRRAFDLGITHFDLANNYGPPPGSAEETFRAHFPQRFEALPRRIDHFHQGGLFDVAGALRRMGFAQISGRQPRPEFKAPETGLRGHFLFPSARPRHAAGGNDGRAGLHRAQRAGAIRRHFQLSAGAGPSGRENPARARHALPDSPAVLQHVQPWD